MQFEQVMGMALSVIYVLVGFSLFVLLVQLIRAVISSMKAVKEVQEQAIPTLKNIQEITEDLKPVVAKMDPLVDRVTLSVDALNLELMRTDKILEDLSQITDAAAKTTEALNEVAHAPANLVNAMLDKVKDAVLPAGASPETRAMEQGDKASSERKPFSALLDQGAAALSQLGQVFAGFEKPDSGAEAQAGDHVAHLEDDVDVCPVNQDEYYTYKA